MTPEWISVVAPFISGALGIGVSYGIMKSSLEALKERVIRNEAKLDFQVGEKRCIAMRQACQEDICRDIKEIKEEVRHNRDFVSTKLDDVSRFMGKMNGINSKKKEA